MNSPAAPRMIPRIVHLVALAVPLWFAPEATAEFLIERLTTITGDSPSPRAAINNHGQVALLTKLPTAAWAGTSVYRFDGPGTPTVIAGNNYAGTSDYGGPIGALYNFVSINDRGEVAFTSGSAFTLAGGDGRHITEIMTRGGSAGDWSMGGPSINNSGVVAAIGSNLDGNYGPDGGAILSGSGGAVTTHIDYRLSYPLYYLGLHGVQINDPGSVAFNWAGIDGAANGAYRMDADGSLTTLFDTTDRFAQVMVTGLNDHGMAAWTVYSGMNFWLMIGDGVTTRTVLADWTAINMPRMALNNHGDFAYLLKGELWVSRGGELTRLIGINDSFGGSTVSNVHFSENGLNDLGQLAFGIDLANGERGVFRSSYAAAAVPEPSALALASLGGVLTVAAARRRRG